MAIVFIPSPSTLIGQEHWAGLSLLRPAKRSELWLALGFTLAVGSLFAVSFLPTALKFASYFSDKPRWQELGFPALAWLFYASMPGNRNGGNVAGSRKLALQISVLPLVIAALFGVFDFSPGLIHLWLKNQSCGAMAWYLLWAPIGEELIFRGWFYNVFDKIWPKRSTGMTNAMPLPLLFSSLAFSLWHFQNITTLPLSWVCFQGLYTFLAGLWFGYLRWKTGDLLFPVFAHIAANLAVNLV